MNCAAAAKLSNASCYPCYRMFYSTLTFAPLQFVIKLWFRIVDLREKIDQRFVKLEDKLDSNFKWLVGIYIPLTGVLLAAFYAFATYIK